jgi:hypothetical protein
MPRVDFQDGIREALERAAREGLLAGLAAPAPGRFPLVRIGSRCELPNLLPTS